MGVGVGVLVGVAVGASDFTPRTLAVSSFSFELPFVARPAYPKEVTINIPKTIREATPLFSLISNTVFVDKFEKCLKRKFFKFCIARAEAIYNSFLALTVAAQPPTFTVITYVNSKFDKTKTIWLSCQDIKSALTFRVSARIAFFAAFLVGQRCCPTGRTKIKCALG